MPIFSVIMNCLNGEKFLPQAIDSLYNQTFQDWELIFFDSGSSDKSIDIAASYGHKVKIFSIEFPIPLGAARQAAIEKAEGNFLAFLDVDDIWLPEKLHLQYQIMKSGEFDICYGGVICIDQSNKLLHSEMPIHESGFIFEKLLYQVEGNWCTYVINRSKLLEKGTKFNPNLRCSSEEDMVLNFLATNGKGAVIKKVIAYYRVNQSSVTTNNKDRFEFERFETLKRLQFENPGIREKYYDAFNEFEARGYYYRSKHLMDQKNHYEAKLALNQAINLKRRYLVLLFFIRVPLLWNFIHNYKGYIAPFWFRFFKKFII
jgi:glycosyltransferase involved in cell wall biosynthesis